MRKSKIVCTLGPKSGTKEVIEQMIDSGMNVARINMSHGDEDSWKILVDNVKTVRKNLDKPVAIMLDTKGPEFRIGKFEDGKALLEAGNLFTLTTANVLGNETLVGVSYKKLPDILSAGDKILLSDGAIELEVIAVSKYDIVTKIITGGELSNNKSINLPDIVVDMPYLSDADKADIRFAIEQDADYLALSFVSQKSDVDAVRDFIRDNNGKKKNIKLIAKIESQRGVDNIDEILQSADGVMVARGDLGVEVEMKKIPIYQKLIIDRANKVGKISIVATQMLESMISAPRPTRAELTDVANAVLDGATALMLSGETAIGAYVTKVIATMAEIITECETSFKPHKVDAKVAVYNKRDFSRGIAYAGKALCDQIEPSGIVVVTVSGKSAFEMASLRPNATIIALTPEEKTYYQLALCHGAEALHIDYEKSTDELLAKAKKLALKYELVQKGDVIIQTCGMPLDKNETNIIKIDIV